VCPLGCYLRMRNLWLILLLCLVGCSAKKKPVAAPTPPPPAAAVPAPVRSQMPPPTAEVIEHCVVTKQENANTVSCRCEPVTTRIDSKTGHTVIVCKKMPQTR
jgi:hypothetical protein